MKKIKLNSTYNNWLISLVLASFTFGLSQPALAQFATSDLLLSRALKYQALGIGTSTIDGYQQIFYQPDANTKKVLTTGAQNSLQPDLSGNYIVWVTQINGAGQVFRYHIPTDSTIQITHGSTNLNPKVDSQGHVVWEHWLGEFWQIYLFDGAISRPLTFDNTAVHPDVENGYVIWSIRDSSDLWKTQAYLISQSRTVDITVGRSNKITEINHGRIDLTPDFASRSAQVRLSSFFALDLGLTVNVEPSLPISDPLPPVPTLTEAEISALLEEIRLAETETEIDEEDSETESKQTDETSTETEVEPIPAIP